MDFTTIGTSLPEGPILKTKPGRAPAKPSAAWKAMAPGEPYEMEKLGYAQIEAT